MANKVTITGIKYGTTTITASYTDGGKTVTTSVKNFQVTAIAPALTFAAGTPPTYNGESQSLGTVSYNGDGTAYYYIQKATSQPSTPSASASGWTAISNGGTISAQDAGTYYIFLKAVSDTGDNYTGVEPKVGGNNTINKRTVTVTEPVIKTDPIKYTGSSQVLLSGNGSCTTGGTMYYYVSTSSTAPTSFSTTTWSTSVPSKTDVGTYYIWYYAYVSDTNNNTGININTIKSLGSKEIEQRTGAAPTFNADSVTATCVQSAAAVNASVFDAATAGHSGSITYSITGVVKDGTTTQLTGWSMTTTTSRIIVVPASTKPGTYKVTVRATEAQTTTDTSSYKDAVITVTLSKGSQSLTLTSSPTTASTTYPTGGTITASGHVGTISASSAKTSVATVSTSGSTVTVTAKSYGTSVITVTAAATDYVNEVSKTVTWSVARRNGAAPTFSNDTVTATCSQDQSAKTTSAFKAATAGHSGTLSYSLVSAKSGSTSLDGWNVDSDNRTIGIPANTIAGTYTVVVRANETQTSTDTSSYKDATITVNLGRGTQSLTLTSSPTTASTTYPTGGTITASGHVGTISASSATKSVATVSTSGSKVTVSAVGYGTTEITVTASQTDYVNAVSKTVAWSVARRTGATPTFNTSTVTATCSQDQSAKTTSAFTAATANHGGTLSYSIVSAKNSSGTTLPNWTVNSSNRTIGIPKDTIAGTYTVVVRANETQTSTDTSSYKDTTITVVLEKGSQTLTLDKTTLSLTVPNTGTITASGYAGTLSVLSNKTSVATASNSAASTITAIGVGDTTSESGSATITFTAAATDYVKEVSQTATVTVTRRTGAAPTFSASRVTATCSQDQSAKTTSAFTAGTSKHSGTLSYSLVSVKNSNGDTLTNWGVNSNNRTIGIPANTIAGTYTVVVKCTESQTSSDTSSSTNATITVTLSKGSQSLTLTGNPTNFISTYNSGGTITASNHVGTISASSSDTSVATVSVSGSKVTVTCVAVGTSTITVTAAANDYVNAVSKTQVWTINKANATLPTTWAGDSVEYHNEAKLTATGYVGGTLKYRYDVNNGTSWTETTTPPTRTAIGTTAVQCMVVGDSNHNDSAWSSTVTLDVYKSDDARMTVTLPSSLTYNTNNQTIASASGIEGVGTYYLGYKVGSEATADSQITWGSSNTTPLQVKNAGTYYVYYKFSPDTNHSNNKDWTYVGSVVVDKASRSGAVSCNDVTYGSTVQASVSGNTESGTVTWGITAGTGAATISSTGVVTPTQAGTVTVTASVAATANYKAYTATSKTITISKAAGAITYNTVTSVSEYCTSTAAAMSQTDANKSVVVATSSASSSTNTGVTIGYTINSVTKGSSSFTGWTVSSNGQTVTVPKGTAAGTYSVKITATAPTTTNYEAVSVQKTVSVVINAVELVSINLVIPQTTIVFGGTTTASVYANYNNGSDPKDITTIATYSSDPTGIVTITK